VILVNGCSHTHGTNHAIEKGYFDKLWPNVAGEMLGDTNVVNLAKGGDDATCITDSTIHWLETSTVKPDMVIVQWTYSDRFSIPYHRKYADDPFRDGATADALKLNQKAPHSDSYVFLQQFPREGPVKLTSTGIYLERDDETSMLKKVPEKLNHLGLHFPNLLFKAGFKQDIHPYFLQEDENPEVQDLIDFYKRYVDYREALCNLPTHEEYCREAWARAQNHLASYLEAHGIPYYWWNSDCWYKPEMLDYFYLKPKFGHEMFGNIMRIDPWLEKQGIMANGDIVDHSDVMYVDDHRGEDGHRYIGEMVANFILHGIEPDANAEDREHAKEVLESRPNLLGTNKFYKDTLFKTTGNNIDPKYKELWQYTTEPDYNYRPQTINTPRYYYE